MGVVHRTVAGEETVAAGRDKAAAGFPQRSVSFTVNETGSSTIQRSARRPGASAPRSESPKRSAAESVAIRIARLRFKPASHGGPDAPVNVALPGEKIGMAVVGRKTAPGHIVLA